MDALDSGDFGISNNFKEVVSDANLIVIAVPAGFVDDVSEKLTATLNEIEKQKVEISELKEKVAGYELNALLNNVKVIDDATLNIIVRISNILFCFPEEVL